MNLRKIGGNRVDENFWQILVVCSADEFKTYAHSFIAALELNSPDTRLVFCVPDIDHECELLLKRICSSVFGLSIYLAETSHRELVGSVRMSIAKELLTISRIHTFVVDVKAVVRSDLTLIPVYLQRADVSVETHFGKKQKSRRVMSDLMWLSPNAKAASFLDEAIRFVAPINTRDLNAENRGVYAALVRSRGFVSLVRLPNRYAGRSLQDSASVWALPYTPTEEASHLISAERERFRVRFDVVPRHIVLMPKQDLGTKTKLNNNSFRRRTERLSRPGRIYWRYIARHIQAGCEAAGSASRIVPVPQWEVRRSFRDLETHAEQIFVPHMLRRQLDSPKASFYMQELLPSLFTVDPDGWGPSGAWYGDKSYLELEPDIRLDDFLAHVRKERLTKAPQETGVRKAPPFDILAPLQVPGDDALIYHADIGIEDFVALISDFANAHRVRVLFRPHPHDHTGMSVQLKDRFASEYVAFSDAEHIHDLIARASVVAVINSGVGFESMLYDRPVVCFGRAVYDTAVHVILNGDIATAYNNAIQEAAEDRIDRYRRFISWYIYKIGYKLDDLHINTDVSNTGVFKTDVNRFYSDIQRDLSIDRKGLKKYSIPNEDRYLQFKANLNHRQNQIVKSATAFLKRINKKYFLELDSLARSRLMRGFDPSILTGKRVALVGNASSALTYNTGSEIDAHDIIIRMNLGYPYILRRDIDLSIVPKDLIQGTFFDARSTGNEKLTVLRKDLPEDVLQRLTHIGSLGSKTTIWSCSTADRKRQLFFGPLFDCTTVACHPHYQNLHLRFILEHQVRRLPEENYLALRDELGIEPTSGLLWINYLLSTSLSKLSIYGFDFFATGHAMRQLPNTLEVTGRWRHDPGTEKEYVLRILNGGDPRVSVFPNPAS